MALILDSVIYGNSLILDDSGVDPVVSPAPTYNVYYLDGSVLNNGSLLFDGAWYGSEVPPIPVGVAYSLGLSSALTSTKGVDSEMDHVYSITSEIA